MATDAPRTHVTRGCSAPCCRERAVQVTMGFICSSVLV